MRLTALLDAVPQRTIDRPEKLEWADRTLARHWPTWGDASADGASADRAHAWGTGSVVNNETLVQTRPLVRGSARPFVEDLLRAEARITVGAFSSRPPGGTERLPNVPVARYHRWVIVASHCERLADDAQLRVPLQAGLPDFLTRASGRGTTPEVLLFALLAELHRGGELGSTYTAPQAIGRALAWLDARFAELAGAPAEGEPHAAPNLLLTDGRTLGVLHRHERLFQTEAPGDGEDDPSRRPLARRRRTGMLVFAQQSARDDLHDTPCRELDPGVLVFDPASPTPLAVD